MVFKYKRKTNRQSWPIESMQQAVNTVISGEMGYHRASVAFGIPQTTLERHVKKQRDNRSNNVPIVFSDVDFLPSATTDIEREYSDAQETQQNGKIHLNSHTLREGTPEQIPTQNINHQPGTSRDMSPERIPSQNIDPQPGTSRDRTPERIPSQNIDPQPGTLIDLNSSFKFASPKHILPIPKADQKKKRVASRKKGKTAILTSSPYKTELEESQTKNKKGNLSLTKGKTIKRKLSQNWNSQANQSKKNTETALDSDSDTNCLYCGDLYSTSSESWISCSNCRKWAHVACSGVEDDDDEAVLICELCR